MWRRYEPPAEHEPEDPEQPVQWPVLPDPTREAQQPQQARRSSYPSNGRGPSSPPGASGKSPAAGLVGGMVGVLGAVAIGIGASGSADSPSFEQSEWDACIESYADEEPGLLSPADLCEIGDDRPPGYTGYDDYDY